MYLIRNLLLALPLISVSLASAQGRPAGAAPRPFAGISAGPRPFAGPANNVPAPLGTRVPVNYNNNYYRRHGYDYGYAGIGLGIGYDPFYGTSSYGVGGFVWGGAYNGFYSNGFSEYGPPVPTYAPVPGMFGGSDQRFLGNNPGPFTRTPITAGDVKLKYDGPVINSNADASIPITPLRQIPATPISDVVREPVALPTRAKLAMDLIVPDNAQVFFDDAATSQIGKVRSYVSPEKALGDPVEYQVRVDWIENGVPMTKKRKVTGNAGERVVVDLTKE